MKLRTFSLAAVVLALAPGCADADGGTATAESPVTGVPIGDVRGIVDVTKTLRTRLFDEADPRTATFDVSRVSGPVFRLRKQLGVFALEGTSSTYLGGTPTPLRATLWHQIMGRFATAVGGMCLSHPPGADGAITFTAYASGPEGTVVAPASFRFRADIGRLVAQACALSGDELSRREVTASLWDAVMGLGGTLAAEKASFVTAFAADGSPALKVAPQNRVADMVLAMLLNPHFLLAK